MTKHAESSEPVTVLKSSDAATLAVAKSLLEEAKIDYYAKGEAEQDLFAWGRMGTGFNPVVGEVELQVAADEAERASDLLSKLRQHKG